MFTTLPQIHYFLPHILQSGYVYTCTGLLCTAIFYGQLYLLVILFHTFSFYGLLTFLYPLMIYSALYYPNLLKTFNWLRSTSTSNTDILLTAANFFLLPQSIGSLNSSSSVSASSAPTLPPVHHICSSASPYLIREEVEKLKNIFNDRLKFIIFRSIFVAYYGSFVPMALVPANHEYDTFWTTQHIAVTWMCTFFMLTSHLYSPQFYDILHQSSLHLGKWHKLETRNTLVPSFQWADGSIYGPGIVVRHAKEYFKSEANMTSAEPGNQSHLRFYVSTREW